MKGRIWTKLVLFFLLAAVVIALFVPEAVGRIYERQTLGEASYEQVSYEPYEIRYYDSFAEKLDAIAGCVFRGEEIYKLQIGERTDNVSDAELMQIVNEELQKMYDDLLLPQKVSIHSISQRSFMELYTLSDAAFMEEADGDQLRNIYLWKLDCFTDDGTISVQIDSEFHKIYAVTLYVAYEDVQEQWDSWSEQCLVGEHEEFVKGWILYWELEDVQWRSVNHMISDANSAGVVDLATSDSGEGSVSWKGSDDNTFWVYLYPGSGNELELYLNMFDYYKKSERGLNMGLCGIL